MDFVEHILIDKAVVIRCQKYNGSMFDAFEYFYRLWELDKDVKFVSLYKHINKEFLSLKYIVDEKCFENFIYKDPYDLKFNKTLLLDTHDFYPKNLGLDLKTNKLYVVSNSNINFGGNVEYFSEYFRNKNYINKIYYKIHRIFEHKDNVYINSMDPQDFEFIKLLKKYPNAIIKDPKNNFQSFKLTNGFSGDFYKYFNKYFYVKGSKTFDRQPRQFTECAYQGIECFYISSVKNKLANNDNSWPRFQDRFDFEKRNIKNDIVIDKLLNEKL